MNKKTVWITGASSGIGQEFARQYARLGFRLILTARRKDRLDALAEELREQHSPVYVCALCPGPVNTEFNDRADVVFALKGISPELCVEEAMRGMLRRKTIIVPSALMRAATTAQKLVPAPLLMPILARQQKRKLGR